MKRRTHIKRMAGLAGALFLSSSAKSFSRTERSVPKPSDGKIITVTGEINPSEMGLTLPHEHVFSTFGNDPERYPSYPEMELMESVIPYLKKLKDKGVKTIADATAVYFGRHPEYLKRISEETGINILTNTGYYSAANNRYVPEFAFNETADEIADRWITEFTKSIDSTGIYPGFIKTAVVHKPLNDIEKKLITAAAKTHKKTGLAIQTHVGKNIPAANEVIDTLSENDVDAKAWVWVHANQVENPADLIPMARMGAYISFDGLTEENTEQYLAAFKIFKRSNLMNRLLLSHDGNAFKNEGTRKDFHYLVTGFKPRFLAYGFTEDDFKQITEKNPANLFTVQERLL